MTKRVYGEIVALRKPAVAAFFADRAARYDERQPLAAVIYQDKNPELAESRNQHEKNFLVPLLDLRSDDVVLDIGCGIGRWAEHVIGNVCRYHGTDFSPGLVEIAKRRFASYPHVTFQTIEAPIVGPDTVELAPPYSLILVVGLMNYLDDHECKQVFRSIARCAGPLARILVREPIGVGARLTLDELWSEELRANYSSIYRTHAEFMQMIQDHLSPAGFVIMEEGPVYPDALQNRSDTRHHFFVLKREEL